MAVLLFCTSCILPRTVILVLELCRKGSAISESGVAMVYGKCIEGAIVVVWVGDTGVRVRVQ